jgi:para-nitrobenzyl esterase
MHKCLMLFAALLGLSASVFAQARGTGSAPVAPSPADTVRTMVADTVRTGNGLVSGVWNANKSVLIYRGIPYAAPPIGNLRWRAPQPAPDWVGVRPCDQFGPNAPQGDPVPFGVYTAAFLIPAGSKRSEDCLYLNVWTAPHKVGDKRPVIVFIHGGAFLAGSGSVPIYDGQAMAQKGIVFVTINYRMGVFGFLAHPELTKESPHHTSGNYGILDQIAALEWVKRNIAAFGGDPGNVTIAGQSAGSMSVNTLVASPVSRGLFSKAIAESGGYVVKSSVLSPIPLAEAEAKGLDYQAKVGAQSLEELRRMDPDKLLNPFIGTNAIIVDGYVLPDAIQAIFAQNKEADVPLLTGSNGNEPLEQFGVQSFSWAFMQSEYGHHKAYLYFFDRKIPEFGGTEKYGAFHTGEVMYAYDNLAFLNRPFVKADQELASLMSAYWVNFARTGDPNGPGLPHWPAFSLHGGETMVFDPSPKAEKHPFYEDLNHLRLQYSTHPAK